MAREISEYLLLDSRSVPIARGRLEGPTHEVNWQIRVMDGKIDEVLKHKQFKLMSITDSDPSYEGTVVRSRNDLIQLEVKKVRINSQNLRQNLRVAVRFKSFVYSVSGNWKGRWEVESTDLSCGGIAFFCDRDLGEREQVEVVVPVTSQPLVVMCELLRRHPTEREGRDLFAAKFIGLCDDEEMCLREAVFSLQLRSPPRGQ